MDQDSRIFYPNKIFDSNKMSKEKQSNTGNVPIINMHTSIYILCSPNPFMSINPVTHLGLMNSEILFNMSILLSLLWRS